jgi:hypothetical protein
MESLGKQASARAGGSAAYALELADRGAQFGLLNALAVERPGAGRRRSSRDRRAIRRGAFRS